MKHLELYKQAVKSNKGRDSWVGVMSSDLEKLLEAHDHLESCPGGLKKPGLIQKIMRKLNLS